MRLNHGSVSAAGLGCSAASARSQKGETTWIPAGIRTPGVVRVAQRQGKAEGKAAARALAADDDRCPRVLAGQPAVGGQGVVQRRGERVLGREPVVGDE